MPHDIPPPATRESCSPIWRYAKKHPIYRYRSALIVAASVGIILCYLSIDGSSRVVGAIPFLVLSGLLGLSDLLSWASRRVEKPDEEPVWPTRFYMVCDVIMCWIMFLLFTATTAASANIYRSPSSVCLAWAALAHLCCSFFHAVCFWKELMARYRSRWRAEMSREPCPRCAYVDVEEPAAQNDPYPREDFLFAGPSTDHLHRGRVMTPQYTESQTAEECLIGSVTGPGSGYGSIDRPEQILDQVERVVTGKGKKKKSSSMKGSSSS